VNCPDCAQPVIEVELSGHTVLLDAQPGQGQVLVVGDRGVLIDGPMLGEALKAGLPVHRRHRTHCPNPWGRPDLRPPEIPSVEVQLLVALLAQVGITATPIREGP
jgi:hypothetical protein